MKQTFLANLRALLILSMLGLAGCAVLDVRVDVYKGSLSNSDDSQNRQLDALVASAEPVLIGFHNTFDDDNYKVIRESVQKILIDFYGNPSAQITTSIQGNGAKLYSVAGLRFTDEAKAKSFLDSFKTSNRYSARFCGSGLNDGSEKAVKAAQLAARLAALQEYSTAAGVGITAGKQPFKTVVNAFYYPSKYEGNFAVFAAIGNSILSITDELDHRRAFDSREVEKLEKEISAAGRVLVPRTVAFLALMLSDVQGRIAQLETEKEGSAVSTKVESLRQMEASLKEKLASPPKEELKPTPEEMAGWITDLIPEGTDQTTATEIKIVAQAAANGTEWNLTKTYRNRAELVDALLAQLHYRLVYESRVGCNLSPATVSAIETLERRRLAVSKIPSPASLLRSTTRVPGMQATRDESTGNKLWDHLVSALPLPPLLTTSQKRRYEREINAQLDANQWQPINQIRLRGTGDINYVLVKDDIGNWYVKTYSASKKDIFATLGSVGKAYLTPGAPLATASQFKVASQTQAPSGDSAAQVEFAVNREKIIEALFIDLQLSGINLPEDTQKTYVQDLKTIHDSKEMSALAREEAYLNRYKFLLADLDDASRKLATTKAEPKIAEHFSARETAIAAHEKTLTQSVLDSIP